MNFKRSERVSELLRHEISQLVQEIADPRIGFVTITGVDITNDLTDAKVYYSVFGSAEERKVSSEILLQSVPSIRHVLGRKLESLYRVPTLDFVYDHSAERAQRVLSILKKISEDKEEEAQDPKATKLRAKERVSFARTPSRKKKSK